MFVFVSACVHAPPILPEILPSPETHPRVQHDVARKAKALGHKQRARVEVPFAIGADGIIAKMVREYAE